MIVETKGQPMEDLTQSKCGFGILRQGINLGGGNFPCRQDVIAEESGSKFTISARRGKQPWVPLAGG